MPYVLEDLIINRVDLVDEGANSEAFIELYKRKEQSDMELNEILSKMKPEHAAVIQEALNKAAEDVKTAEENLANAEKECGAMKEERDKALEDLNAANEDLENTKSELETLREEEEKREAGSSFDETETLKSMPENVRAVFEKMKQQKEAAEEELRKSREAEAEAEAVAKAKELKAIPVDQDKLVGIVKNANADLLDLLTVVNAAIEGTVLDEVGKSHPGDNKDAWSKIEAKASEIEKRDSVTKAKAISIAIKENPDLYKEYLQGGAN